MEALIRLLNRFIYYQSSLTVLFCTVKWNNCKRGRKSKKVNKLFFLSFLSVAVKQKTINFREILMSQVPYRSLEDLKHSISASFQHPC